MKLHSNDYVYEVVPPFFGEQQKLLTKSKEAIEAVLQEYPEVSTEAISTLAREKVLSNVKHVWFGLKAIGQRDVEHLESYTATAYGDYARDKAIELIQGESFKQIKNKVDSINNLEVDDVPITTLEQLRDTDSCKDYYQWVCAACSSVLKLTMAERKNFMPGSGSPA